MSNEKQTQLGEKKGRNLKKIIASKRRSYAIGNTLSLPIFRHFRGHAEKAFLTEPGVWHLIVECMYMISKGRDVR